jgi:hypothetical protein
MASARACASAESVSTMRLNTPTGGPSIESNAMVGLEPEDVVSAAFEVLDVVQPDASALMSTAKALPAIARARTARLAGTPTTLAPPRRRRGGSLSAFA